MALGATPSVLLSGVEHELAWKKLPAREAVEPKSAIGRHNKMPENSVSRKPFEVNFEQTYPSDA